MEVERSEAAGEPGGPVELLAPQSFVDQLFGTADRSYLRRSMAMVRPGSYGGPEFEDLYRNLLRSALEEAPYLPGFTTLQEMMLERACALFVRVKASEMAEDGPVPLQWKNLMEEFRALVKSLSDLKTQADLNLSFKRTYIGLVGAVLTEWCTEFFEDPNEALAFQMGYLTKLRLRLAEAEGA